MLNNGVATCPAPVTLSAGTNNLTGTYSGDGNYASGPVGPAVVDLLGDFTVAATPASQSVRPGVEASFPVNVTGVNGQYTLTAGM